MYCEKCGKHMGGHMPASAVQSIIENEGGFCKCGYEESIQFERRFREKEEKNKKIVKEEKNIKKSKKFWNFFKN